MADKYCRLCGDPKSYADFTKKASSDDGYANECRDCQRTYRMNQDRKRQGIPLLPYGRVPAPNSTPVASPTAAQIVATAMAQAPAVNVQINAAIRQARTAARAGSGSAPLPDSVSIAEKVEELAKVDVEVKNLKPGDFVQSAEVLATWVAVQKIAKAGHNAPNLFFRGPSGSGKTEAAKDLARRSELPFLKVDAPSMVDPESWFGTREVVVEDGAPKTVYVPSGFIEHIQKPGVTLIDEVNRVSDMVRNILIPLFDDSRQVTNPLTGQVVRRHEYAFVIMTGNVGLAYTGTYAVDPALLTRALTTNFTYLQPADEIAVVVARTNVDRKHADYLVRFAGDTRKKAQTDDEFLPVSTREVLAAAFLVAQGLDLTTAVRQSVINSASEEGGAESQRAQLEYLWKGIYKEVAAA